MKGHIPQGFVGTSGTLHEERLSPLSHRLSCAYLPHTTPTCCTWYAKMAGWDALPEWEGAGPSLPPASSRPEVKAGRVVLDSSLACV